MTHGTVNYYALLPAAAVRRGIDGNLYAWVNYTVAEDGVKPCAARMIRVNELRIQAGVARVWIGSMGAAIAQTKNLPFGVEASES